MAGGGLGTSSTNGLIIDTSGWNTLTSKFTGATGNDRVAGELYPTVGYILTGTAASGASFSFGVTGSDSDVRGQLAEFTPASGQAGGDVIGISVGNGALTKGFDPVTGESLFKSVPYQIVGIATGNGGTAARGGDIINVTLNGDVNGFFAIAGNGGNGNTGGRGGSITNLSDLGSYTTQVDIIAGNGGDGYSGFGGAGGTIGGLGGAVGLGQFSTTGNVRIILGDGGDGVAGGGNGSGLNKAAFTPIQVEEVPIPVQLLTTYREIGGPGQSSSIGTPLSLDFNGDGLADIAYLAQNPTQLVVRLGVDDGFGGGTINATSPTFFLSGPNFSGDRSVGLTAGDFNGDGFLDLAVASNVEYSRDGIHVFLWNDEVGGFNLPTYSAIPFFNLGGFAPSYLRSGGAITNLVAGDFNGDGVVDLGFTGQYFSASEKRTALVTLSGTGDGYFFADFQYDAKSNQREALPILEISIGHSEFLLQASAIDGTVLGKQTDVLVFAAQDNDKSKSISVVQNAASLIFPEGQLQVLSTQTGLFRDRTFNDKTDTVDFSSKTTAPSLVDFAILDVDGDGIFDVVGLYPNGGIVAFQGDGAGEIKQIDGGKGILLTGEYGALGANSEQFNQTFRGILSGNFDGDAATSNIAVYNTGEGDDNPRGFFKFTFDAVSPFVQSYNVKTPEGGVAKDGSIVPFFKPTGYRAEVEVFATYNAFIGDDTKQVGFGVGSAGSKIFGSAIEVGGGDVVAGFNFLYNVGFFLEAGDGGDSQLGAGGKGGSFGSGGVAPNASGNPDDMPQAAITLLIPGSNAKFSANFQFEAGNGGSGFSAGGAGGSVSGVAARYVPDTGLLASSVELYGGDGGKALLGKGGAGGNISGLSILTLEGAFAGNGGFGINGGAGGSILGNNQSSLYDARDSTVQLVAGNGGDGVKSGGAGGNISSFFSGFLAVAGGVGGFLNYQAGDGGNALAGKGGLGGSILNSGPDRTFNNLAGNITVHAGNGGSGLIGGHGGNITNFINSPSPGISPSLASFIAGNGGDGISGAGGNGGSISGVTVSSDGPSIGFTGFNRYIAGDGGDSLGSTGGSGGSLIGVTASSTSSSLALAAGAGGDGLTRGGNGGSVTTTQGAAAGSDFQILVVGGNGGNATAFLATSLSPNPTPVQSLIAFGGVAGVGGNGGNITGFTQSGGTTVSVNLVAGNGGSLMNYGNPSDLRPNVGQGGSVNRVSLAGNAGNMDSEQAIVSHYATTGYDNMSEFVDNWLKATFIPNLTNAIGNVGVVAGAAGRVSVNAFPASEGLPSNNGVNGSVTNFSARNIMSMVAGSVERISAIQTLSNVSVSAGGIVGAWKNTPIPHPSNSPLYFDGNGNPTSVASPGGALMDGAVLARANNSSLSGIRVFTA
jgi:hypothetical protein